MTYKAKFAVYPAAIAVAALGASSLAFAEGGAPGLADLDVDADGQISQQEASADVGVSASFQDLDVNQDGSLDSGEFARFEEESDDSSLTDDSGLGSDMPEDDSASDVELP